MKSRKNIWLILLLQLLIVATPVLAQKVNSKKVNTQKTKIKETQKEANEATEPTNASESTEIKDSQVENDQPESTSSNVLKKSIGVWGGMYFPISPSGSNSGIGYGLDGYYQLKEKIQIGAGIGILPYKVAAVGSLFASSVNFSFMPVLFQFKYLATERVFVGAGIGIVLASGELSGYGTGLSFFGGYAYPVKENLSLDFGLKSYIIKDSESDAYINLIPNIGITYKF